MLLPSYWRLEVDHTDAYEAFYLRLRYAFNTLVPALEVDHTDAYEAFYLRLRYAFDTLVPALSFLKPL